MMARITRLALLVAALAAVGLLGARPALMHQVASCSDGPSAVAMVPGDPRLTLEIADTPAKQRLGLMGRESLPEEHGMLFVFEPGHRGGFWMRNTLIPLSIAFLDPNGVVLDIQDMEPLSEEAHSPGKPYMYALEVNQGWFERNGVGVGAQFIFCLPQPASS